MKKVIFLMGVGTICFISCTSSKKNITSTSTQDYYKNNYYAKNYMDAPGLISRDVALTYINAFQKHKYRGLFNKNKLNNPWSTFDRNTLDKLVKDKNTDSIFFFLAAYPKNYADKDKRGHPFVIMKGITKHPQGNDDGNTDSSTSFQKPVYFIPRVICPPPDNGCRIPGGN